MPACIAPDRVQTSPAAPGLSFHSLATSNDDQASSDSIPRFRWHRALAILPGDPIFVGRTRLLGRVIDADVVLDACCADHVRRRASSIVCSAQQHLFESADVGQQLAKVAPFNVVAPPTRVVPDETPTGLLSDDGADG